ncbi:MAG TPA: trypsin-like serine protease [Polyangiaceae bacterium]|nr:trypsin-like serine protease [Polyangiaceae bacterium]
MERDVHDVASNGASVEALMKLCVPACLALTALLGCTAPIDENVARDRDAIVNGQPTTGDPAVVYVDMGCSGTLITPKIVLTACHCMQQVSSPPSVFFGSNIEEAGTWINSVHYEIYPGQCSGDGDFALLTLSEPGPTTPVPANNHDLQPYIGNQVRIVGFGVTSENGQDIGLKRMGTSVLGSLEPGVMFCNASSPSGTCYGDSGGPSFMTIEGQEYVVGATSYGTEACGSGLDASARTDSHYDWITQYIAANDPNACGADGACMPSCQPADPDCVCISDGNCDTNCPNGGVDPDCDACGDNGVCQQDCPTLDNDCCAANGICHAVCIDHDPDCPGSTPGTPGSPNNPSRAAEEEPASGGCSATGKPNHEWLWLLVSAAVVVSSARRGAASRSATSARGARCGARASYRRTR